MFLQCNKAEICTVLNAVSKLNMHDVCEKCFVNSLSFKNKLICISYLNKLLI
jgi:hypothetical protein